MQHSFWNKYRTQRLNSSDNKKSNIQLTHWGMCYIYNTVNIYFMSLLMPALQCLNPILSTVFTIFIFLLIMWTLKYNFQDIFLKKSFVKRVTSSLNSAQFYMTVSLTIFIVFLQHEILQFYTPWKLRQNINLTLKQI